MSGLYVNDGGTWKTLKDLNVYDGGQWKDVYQAYVKDGGTWKAFWPPEATFGWHAGNFNTTSNGLTTVQRKDFSNDSNNYSTRTALPAGRGFNTGTGNKDYAWWLGGVDPSFVSTSTIYRTELANDSTAASNRGNLNVNRDSAGSCGNPRQGYIAGGLFSGTGSDQIEKITFSSDTSSSNAATFGTARAFISAVNSDTAGYWSGGFTNVSPTWWTTQITKIVFSTDTSSNIAGTMSVSRDSTGSVESRSKGYWAGGYTDTSATTNSSRVDRIDFSTDTVSSIGDILPNAISQMGGISNDSRGFFCGGRTNGFTDSQTTTCQRILFSNETMTTSSIGTLSEAGIYLSSHQGIT